MNDSSSTAATLSQWLRRSGSLPGGEITDVHIDLQHKTPISTLHFLTVTYSSGAPSDLPRRIVVKSRGVEYSWRQVWRFAGARCREAGALLICGRAPARTSLNNTELRN